MDIKGRMKINLNGKIALEVYIYTHTHIYIILHISKLLCYKYVKQYFINNVLYLIEIPAKRTRRSMVPSPSPAEGQASKPESTAILSEVSIICCSI